MQITSLQLKHFRCFDNKTIELDAPVVIIEGNNGTGKTSALEALHYLCYLRSFRTHIPRQLIAFDHENFIIKASFVSDNEPISRELHVGFCPPKRLVKIDQQVIGSYKELMDHFRVVTLVEDDLELIKSGPEVRRSYLDQAILLSDPSYSTQAKKFRHVVDNRNALLRNGVSDKHSFQLWTQQLWELSCAIQSRRIEVLNDLSNEITHLINQYFAQQEISITFSYKSKGGQMGVSFEEFDKGHQDLYEQEVRFGRTLFGAHLDDFSINFLDKRSKSFASRGQQKIIVILMKIAQIKLLERNKGSVVFLLDDFMTDFDHTRVQLLLPMLTDLNSQLIFTAPAGQSPLLEALSERGAQHIMLTG